MGAKKDPLDAIRKEAGRFAGVDEGTACTQSAFRVGKKSFLFVGMQGGRCKLLLKLDDSMPEAEKLAAEHPDDVQVGKGGWVTLRFDAASPPPKRRWLAWVKESYRLSGG